MAPTKDTAPQPDARIRIVECRLQLDDLVEALRYDAYLH